MTRSPFPPLAFLLLLMTSPLDAAFRMGPPQEPIDARITRAPGAQTNPEIATNGLDYLAIWSNEGAVEAARISGEGELVDGLPIAVSAAGDGGGLRPDVAFGSSSYLAVYGALRTVEITPAGEIVARGSIPLEMPIGNAKIAWDGARYLVVWGSDEIRGVFVSSRGEVLGAPFTILPNRMPNTYNVQGAATNGGRYVVLYTWGAQLERIVLGSSGEVLKLPLTLEERNAIVASGSPLPDETAAVESDGRGFVAVWQSVGVAIEAQALSPEGDPVGPVQMVERMDSTFGLSDPEIAWSGGGYLVSYIRNIFVEGLSRGRVETRRLSASGDVIDEPPSIALDLGEVSVDDAAIAWNGAAAIVAGETGHRNRTLVEREIYARKLDAPLATLVLLSRGRPAGARPSVAINREVAVAVWEERRGGTLERDDPVVMAGRWTPEGKPFGTPFEIAPSPRSQSSPFIAAGPATFLVLWVESGVRGVMLDRSGVARSAPFLLLDSRCFGDYGAAWSGSEYLVAIGTCGSLELIRLNEEGAVVGRDPSPLAISTLTGPPNAAVACNDVVCVAAWLHVTSTSTCPRLGCLVPVSEIRIARIARSGSRIDAQPVVLSTNASDRAALAVGVAGREFLVAWEHSGGVRARRLSSSGTALGEELMFPGTRNPSVSGSRDFDLGLQTVYADTLQIVALPAGSDEYSSIFVAGANPFLAMLDGFGLLALDWMSPSRLVRSVAVRRLTPAQHARPARR